MRDAFSNHPAVRKVADAPIRGDDRGTQALRAAAASKPDLVLLDVMMPNGGGFEVVRRRRSSEPDVPVIFLSARDGVPERVAGLELDEDGHERARAEGEVRALRSEERMRQFVADAQPDRLCRAAHPAAGRLPPAAGRQRRKRVLNAGLGGGKRGAPDRKLVGRRNEIARPAPLTACGEALGLAWGTPRARARHQRGRRC